MKEMNKETDILVTVKSIEGNCPVYKQGDRFKIRKGYKLDTNGLELCMHSLGALMPFYNALRFTDPAELGLAEENKDGFIQCPDPCDYTGGGTVIFRLRRGE